MYDATQDKLMDEMCVLVDTADNVVGKATKRFCHTWSNIEQGKALHRAFSVFLFDTHGRLLMQQRSAQKKTNIKANHLPASGVLQTAGSE